MIYWMLHKKITKSDWLSKIEGEPGFLYENLSNLIFVDISNFTLFAKIENLLIKEHQDYINTDALAERYLKINSPLQLKKLLKLNSNDIFVFQTFNNPRITSVLNILNKKDKKTLLLNHWTLPPQLERKNAKKNFIFFVNKIKNISVKVLFMRFLYRIYKKLQNKNLFFDYAFTSGTLKSQKLKSEVLIREILPCHSVSYDEFLLLESKESKSSLDAVPYMVFVDQALTIHPDNKGLQLGATEAYKSEILSALSKISDDHAGIKIIIAEHPRMQYPKGFWGKFECISGKTAELIRYSQGVIGHNSTSLILASFFKKKIFYLTSSNSYFIFDNLVKNTHAILGGTLIDMVTNVVLAKSSGAEAQITDYFTLCPDIKKNNKTLFLEFLSNF